MTRLGLALIAPMLLFAAPAMAQDVDSQVWLTGSATADVAKDVPVLVDTALRFGDKADGLYEWARGMFAGYRFDNGVELLGGYQRVTGYVDGRVSRVENRVRQQVNFTLGKAFGGSFAGRVRIDERFRQASGDVGVRIRPQARLNLPVGAHGFALVASHESFVELNHTDWGQEPGYRRMRNLVGAEIPFARKLRGQLSYLNQYDFGTAGRRDAMANVLVFTFAARF